jgi:tellurite resistance protein TerC
MEFLPPWLGTPLWMWLGFIGIVIALMALDLGVLHRKAKEIGVTESLMHVGFLHRPRPRFRRLDLVVSRRRQRHALHYGFVVEKSLAMDNVFVIAMIFAFFGIPRIHQHRVLCGALSA